MEIEYTIGLNRFKPDAKDPFLHKDGEVSDIFAAEETFIAPGKTIAVSTGLAFVFPDEIGLMFMPVDGLRETAFLRYPKGVFVLQNNSYFQEEVKIFFENTYEGKEELQKVHEYKLVDGTIVADPNNLYDEGTVKICKGDCISRMMPVEAFYPNIDDTPKKLAKK